MSHFANLLVVALSPEWQSLKKKFRLDWVTTHPPVLAFTGSKNALLQCGLGGQQAAESLHHFLKNHTAENVLQVGTCGALDVQLRVGDLVIAEAILNENKDMIKINDLPKLNKQELIVGTLFSSDKSLKTAEEKKAAQKKFGAHIVDMESYAVAKICQEQKIQYACVRGVFDEAHEALTMIGQPFCADGTLSYGRLMLDIIKSPKLLAVLPDFARRQALLDRKLLPVIRRFVSMLILPALLFLNNCSSCTTNKATPLVHMQRTDSAIPLETLSPADERLLLSVKKSILDDTPALKPLHEAIQKWVPEFDLEKARALPVDEILVGAMDWNGRFFSVGRATHGFSRNPKEVETFAKDNGLDLTIETRGDLTYYIFPDDEDRALTDVSQGFFAYGDAEFLDAVRARHALAVDGGPLPDTDTALLKFEIKGEVLGAKSVRIRLLPDTTVTLSATFTNPLTKTGADAALSTIIKADPTLKKFWDKGKDTSKLTQLERQWLLSELPFEAFKESLQKQVQNLMSGEK